LILKAVIASIAVLGTSCQKDSSSSNLKTLDNFAKGGAVALHDCSTTKIAIHPKAPTEKEFGDLYPEFERALSTVPMKVQNLFFDAPNFGTIEPYDDLTGKCVPDEFAKMVLQNVPDTHVKSEEYVGCWIRNPRPIIRLKRDAKAIKYATLRQFGYVWAELQASYSFNKQGVSINPSGDVYHNQFKKGLALAFLQDVDLDVAKKGYTLERFRGLAIPSELLKSYNGQDQMLAERERDALWRKLDGDLLRNFANRVAVETFHSYFCNTTTKDSLRTEFPTVLPRFELEVAEISDYPIETSNHKQNISATGCGYTCRNQASFSKHSQQDYQIAQNRFYNDMKTILAQNISQGSEPTSGFSLGIFGGIFSMFGKLANMLFGGGGSMNNSPFDMGNLVPGGGNFTSQQGGNPFTGNRPTDDFSGDGEIQTPPSARGGNFSGGSGGDAQPVLQLTNQYRQQQGLRALTLSSDLSSGCIEQAQLQKKCGTLAHFLNESCQPHDSSKGYMRIAENIASGQGSPQAVMTSWYNSPGHQRNILTPSHSSLGVGRVGNEWCQRFR
jgi:hypothetical protein